MAVFETERKKNRIKSTREYTTNFKKTVQNTYILLSTKLIQKKQSVQFKFKLSLDKYLT